MKKLLIRVEEVFLPVFGSDSMKAVLNRWLLSASRGLSRVIDNTLTGFENWSPVRLVGETPLEFLHHTVRGHLYYMRKGGSITKEKCHQIDEELDQVISNLSGRELPRSVMSIEELRSEISKSGFMLRSKPAAMLRMWAEKSRGLKKVEVWMNAPYGIYAAWEVVFLNRYSACRQAVRTSADLRNVLLKAESTGFSLE